LLLCLKGETEKIQGERAKKKKTDVLGEERSRCPKDKKEREKRSSRFKPKKKSESPSWRQKGPGKKNNLKEKAGVRRKAGRKENCDKQEGSNGPLQKRRTGAAEGKPELFRGGGKGVLIFKKLPLKRKRGSPGTRPKGGGGRKTCPGKKKRGRRPSGEGNRQDPADFAPKRKQVRRGAVTNSKKHSQHGILEGGKTGPLVGQKRLRPYDF